MITESVKGFIKYSYEVRSFKTVFKIYFHNTCPGLYSQAASQKIFSIFLNIDTFVFINVFPVILTIKQIEKISKALGDQNRLKILHYISNKGGSGPCSGIQHVVDLAQPSISHHVKILIESGLIEPEKDGRNHTYTLNKILLDGYKEFLNHLQP